MKQIYIIGLLAILLVATVSAGSIDGLEYYDKDTNLFWSNSKTRTATDNNVDIDADTLEGKDLKDVKNIMNRKDNKVKDYSDTNDRRIVNVINSKDGQWSTDRVGGGISQTFLSHILYGDNDALNGWTRQDSYTSQVLEMCQEEDEIVNDRIDRIEAKLNLFINDIELTTKNIDLEAALIKSKRTGQHVFVGAYECNGVCIGLSDID